MGLTEPRKRCGSFSLADEKMEEKGSNTSHVGNREMNESALTFKVSKESTT